MIGLDLDTTPHSAFDTWRVRAGLLLGPLCALLVWGAGDGSDQSRLAALFAFTAIWWITEAAPTAATSLIAMCGAILLGLGTPKEIFAAIGNPVLLLFVGGFMVAEAMRIHGLGERFARSFARVAKTQLGALVATSGITFLMSMWASNAAATAIVLPIALSIAKGNKRFAAAMVLAVAWGASMGGLGTPVGTPPNLIGVRALMEAGHPITFFGWMAVGLPIGVAMMLAMWLLLAWRFGLRPGQRLDADAVSTLNTAMPWSRGEVAACCAFAFAVTFWLIPGVLEAAGSSMVNTWKQHCPEEVVALLAAGLLFVWPIQRPGERPVRALSWQQATRIEWGTVLLFAAGIMLGDLANRTGLANNWGRLLVHWTGVHSAWGVIALVTAAAVLLSEIASNTAAATLMVPLAVALSHATNTPVLPAVLGASIGASFGFMMPISTAPNAMAYATGAVSMRQMVTTGIAFDVVGYLVCVVVLGLVSPWFG